MKKLNIKSFLFGILFCAAAFSIYSFSYMEDKNEKNYSQNTVEVVEGISPQLAMTYRNNFQSSNPEAIQAINVSVAQWQAINQEVAYRNNNLENVSGFRLYFGNKNLNSGGGLVALTYVLNNGLTEDPPGANVMMAEGFSRNFAQQCPPFCD